MNVGTMHGGSAKNSVPAYCEISIDFRIANKNHIKMIKNQIEKLVEEYKAKVNIIELAEPFVDEIAFLGESKTTNFMTEASKISSSKRIILGTGPVTAHEVNENISVNSYKALVSQYNKLIYKICE